MKTELLKIPFKDYCKLDAINSSKLKDFFADPKLFYKTYIAKTIEPEEEARHFIVGRAIHCIVLEPHKFFEDFIVGERRKSTKIGLVNHARAQAEGLSLISDDEYKLCQTIQQELPQQDEWCKYHEGAIKVLTEIVIIIEISPGVFLKVMLDRCIEHVDIVYVHDIKSTSKSNSNEFDGSLTEYDYLIQHSFYKYVVEKHFGKPCIFIFVFCSKEEPFNIGFIKIPPHQQDIGFQLFECALSRYVQAQSTETWYPEQVKEREAVIPKYAMEKYLNYINETQLV